MSNLIHGSLKSVALSVLRKTHGWRSEFTAQKFRYIFILGHQRTGSSMLTQIICSHPDVSGFGESRTVYHGRRDLRALRGEVFRIHHRFRNLTPYVLDKVLFNELLPDVDAIDGHDVRYVFLLRDPIRTMRSMIEMFGCEEEQLRYYRDRIAWLCGTAEKLQSRKRSFFTTYDQLLQDSDTELSALSSFLDFDQPLSENYELQPRAGKAGVGDSSDRIKSGKILQKPREHPYHPSMDTSELLLRDFEKAIYVLSRACECTQPIRDFVDGFSSESQIKEIQCST